MKRLLSTINKRPALNRSPSHENYSQDSPESIIIKEVTAFCQEGQGPHHPVYSVARPLGPPSRDTNTHKQGEEYVHLPSIVESAESSPNAAREAAHLLRKLLSTPNSTAANIQYNAIMLMRILIDNPGHTFSRNLDAKFIATVKEMLRQGKDMGVQRFLRETLDALEAQRGWDEDLKPFIEMWKKEKSKMDKAYNNSKNNSQGTWRGSPSRQNSDQMFRVERTDSLPPPDELVSRISEAKTSAKLLMQFVQSTTPAEMLSNDLIQEFSGRCRRASRAIQNYIHATNPPPDEDTLLTLIETNDELSVALSKHQHAMLQARKALGQQTPPAESANQSPEPSDQFAGTGAVRQIPPPLPQRSQTPPPHSPPSPDSPEALAHRFGTTKTVVYDVSSASGNPGAGRYEYRSEDYQVQNPFADNYSIPAILPGPGDDSDRADERGQLNGTNQTSKTAQNP
ncbi:hypothetical protein BJX64DRAFT_85205 [Aspergillus heterothallicus]